MTLIAALPRGWLSSHCAPAWGGRRNAVESHQRWRAGMMDCFAMWRRTRMVTLTAVCAAIYAAVLIPTQVFPLIPGSTNLRPGSAIAIVLSLLFGPAGAWGGAFGNTLNDLFGTFGPGTWFGFFGNFLLGLIPYKLLTAWNGGPPPPPRRAATAGCVPSGLLPPAGCGPVAWVGRPHPL